jgi:hypothetical protein
MISFDMYISWRRVGGFFFEVHVLQFCIYYTLGMLEVVLGYPIPE